MSDLWATLRAEHAFQQTPPLGELGETHVPYEELGVGPAPEPELSVHLRGGPGITTLIGKPGQGKSSVLAFLATQLGQERDKDGRSCLPIFVPVAATAIGKNEDLTLSDFGQLVIRELAASLRDSLEGGEHEEIRQALAEEVTYEQTPNTFNASLTAKVFGVGGEGGFDLAKEVVTTVSTEPPDKYGGLLTASQMADAHGLDLVVLVEDTDAWAQQANADDLAQTFFSQVLYLAGADAGARIAVAVQDRWKDDAAFKGLQTKTLADVVMPSFEDVAQARPALERVLSGRIEGKIEKGTAGSKVDEMFSDAALANLAETLASTNSFRDVMKRISNGLDRHSDALPQQLDVKHIVEADA